MGSKRARVGGPTRWNKLKMAVENLKRLIGVMPPVNDPRAGWEADRKPRCNGVEVPVNLQLSPAIKGDPKVEIFKIRNIPTPVRFTANKSILCTKIDFATA